MRCKVFPSVDIDIEDPGERQQLMVSSVVTPEGSPHLDPLLPSGCLVPG